MAAMSSEDAWAAARLAARKMFVEPNATCTVGLDELQAGILAMDGVIESLPTLLNPVQSVAVNMNNALPANVKNNLTTNQKGLLTAAWAVVKGGFVGGA